jgi:serine protease Do
MSRKDLSRSRLAVAMASLGGSLGAAGQPTVAIVESLEPVAGGEFRAASDALGFFTESDGFLLTTYRHLTDPITGALRSQIRVGVGVDGEMRYFDARIIGVEPTLNFAVLKVDDPPALKPATVAPQRDIEEGQEIFTLRDPGMKEKVLGRLTALNSIECYQESLTQTMYQAEMVQPDTALGSPVLDADGEVLALFNGYEPPHVPGEDEHADDAETHILPMHLVSAIYDSLKQRKSLASPWTGFSVRSLSPEEASVFPVLRGRFKGGIALDHVWPDSPAAVMGLREGDILLQFAYHPTPSPAEFQKWLYMYGVGHDVKLYFLRDGEAFAHAYTIEERPAWAVPK